MTTDKRTVDSLTSFSSARDDFSGCHRFDVGFWFFVKFLFAAGAAKVIGFAAILREILGRRAIHGHSTYRICRFGSRAGSIKCVALNGRLFASSGKNNFGKDAHRDLFGSQGADIKAGRRLDAIY
jgi:hypothetical protein